MKSRTLTNTMLIVLAIILIAIVYLLVRPSSTNKISLITPSATTTPANTPVVQPSVSSATIHETDTANTYEINATYPVLADLPNKTVQANINASIKSAVQKEVANFKLGESDTSVERGVVSADKSSFTLTFKEEPAVSGLINFSLNEEFYSAGAAHPGSDTFSLSYDLQTGKLVQLHDAFTGKYVSLISSQSIKKLNQQMGDSADHQNIQSGAGPVEDNFKVFFLTPNGLEIIFNPYQVAGYAAGAQEVTIPYSTLKPVINPSGPLKNLI